MDLAVLLVCGLDSYPSCSAKAYEQSILYMSSDISPVIIFEVIHFGELLLVGLYRILLH